MTGEMEEYLDKSLDELQPPSLVPAGPWVLKGVSGKMVKKEFESDETGETVKYRQVQLMYAPVEPLPGVDPEAVAKGGFEAAVIFVKRNIYNEGQAARVAQFLQKHGIDTTGRGWEEALKAFRGSTIVGNVTEETYEDENGEIVAKNGIDKFQPLDAQ